MKKYIILLTVLILAALQSEAAVQLKVSAVSKFDTSKPAKTIDVKIREDAQLGEYNLKAGDTMLCKVIDVSSPKRGKRNACFTVQPTEIVSNGQNIHIKEEFYGKYSKTVLSKEELKNMPKGQIVEKAAVTAGSFVIKGLGQGVSMAEGMIKNQEGNRIKSGVKQVYEDSPISYIEKGQDLNITTGDNFYFIFNINDEIVEDKPNYTYTVPENRTNE